MKYGWTLRCSSQAASGIYRFILRADYLLIAVAFVKRFVLKKA